MFKYFAYARVYNEVRSSLVALGQHRAEAETPDAARIIDLVQGGWYSFNYQGQSPEELLHNQDEFGYVDVRSLQLSKTSLSRVAKCEVRLLLVKYYFLFRFGLLSDYAGKMGIAKHLSRPKIRGYKTMKCSGGFQHI